MELTFWGF